MRINGREQFSEVTNMRNGEKKVQKRKNEEKKEEEANVDARSGNN